MTWTDFYLICFRWASVLALFRWLSGSVHLHLPHIHIHFGGQHGYAPHAGGHGPGVINIGTMAAFLAWFGGTGLPVSGNIT